MSYSNKNNRKNKEFLNINSIFPMGIIAAPLNEPTKHGDKPALMIVSVFIFNLLSFGDNINLIKIAGIIVVLTLFCLYYKYKCIYDTLFEKDIVRGDFNSSNNHVIIINDVLMVGLFIVVLVSIFLIILLYSKQISCSLSHSIEFLSGLCDGNLFNYDNHITYGKSLHKLIGLMYLLSTIILCVWIYVRFLQNINRINVTYFSYYSHLSTCLFLLFVIMGIIFIFCSQYWYGFYDGVMSRTEKNGIYLYFYFTYFCGYPFLFMLLVKFFSSVMFAVKPWFKK